MIGRIINAILWIVILGWAIFTGVAYYKFVNNQEQLYCIKNEEYKYDDGKVTRCMGPGYNIYEYDRGCIKGRDFVPFWVKEKSKTAEECK